MRAYSIGVAAAAMSFATLGLLRQFSFGNNESFERITCLAGICASDELAAAAYDMLLAGGPETAAAVERFRTLVVRNPASRRPGDLGGSLETGDTEFAKPVMLQAIERGPAIPQVRIRAAKLFAELGDRAAAGRNLAAVLQATDLMRRSRRQVFPPHSSQYPPKSCRCSSTAPPRVPISTMSASTVRSRT